MYVSAKPELSGHARKLLQPEILCNDEGLLPMHVLAHDFRPITNDKHAKVRIEKAQEVLRIADDVPRRVCIRRDCAHEFACVQPLRVAEALNVARDRIGQHAQHVSHGERHPHAVVTVRMTCYKPPKLTECHNRLKTSYYLLPN